MTNISFLLSISSSHCIMYFIAILLAFALAYAFHTLSGRRKNLPPGPTPLPIIGNLHLLGDLPHRSAAQLAAIHGPVISLRLGHVTTMVVSSAAAAREVLQKHDEALASRAIPDSFHAHRHSAYSVVALPAASPRWRTIRKIITGNIFSGSRVRSSYNLRKSKVQDLIDYCRKKSLAGEAIDVGTAVFDTSINQLFNLIFSKNLTDAVSTSDGELRHLVRNIMVEAGAPNLADFFPVLKKIDPQGIRRRMKVHMGKALQIFRTLIDERLETTKSRNPGPAEDLLEVLLEELDDRTLIEHILLDLFIGAGDTTSSTVEWALAEVLGNPETLKKAKSEMEGVVGKGRVIDESDFRRLPYLQSLVKETFRLHPPVPFLIPRRAERAVAVGGYAVPAGTHVWVNVWAMGRDPHVWESPLEFSPERFLDSAEDVFGADFELIPFGGGRRICPGAAVAARMVPLVVGSLLNSFDWRCEEGLDMAERFGLTMSKARALRVFPVPI
ncbi:geraniol 8-hydroxylase-like [Andrographis paniculata]|uniref:geraniol 8-hydroxylase-like n=1 Tax=Andrographis paniculata TaxID=175694 RepID=UPI0021E8E5CF|nr:geraniol 8-hydroxylase-like [Andrographis paniculata]